MTGDWVEHVRPLLQAPSPAVLTTYRKDGSANVSPVWFRWNDGAFEVVIAEGDVKLHHLGLDARCVLLVFEAVPPFRGVEIRGTPELVEGDVTAARADIAGRDLGTCDGERFAADRRSKPGALLRLDASEPRSGTWPRSSRSRRQASRNTTRMSCLSLPTFGNGSSVASEFHMRRLRAGAPEEPRFCTQGARSVRKPARTSPPLRRAG